jgi:hypothetical protein
MVSRGRSTDLGGVGRVRKTKASKDKDKVRRAKIHGRSGRSAARQMRKQIGHTAKYSPHARREAKHERHAGFHEGELGSSRRRPEG